MKLFLRYLIVFLLSMGICSFLMICVVVATISMSAVSRLIVFIGGFVLMLVCACALDTILQ